MGSEGINFTRVTVLLSSDSEGTCVQEKIKVDTPGEIRAWQARDTASGEAKRR